MDPTYLVFDLETVGNPIDSFDASQQEYLLRYAQNHEERERKINEFALAPLTGRIVCIGMRMVSKDKEGAWQSRDVAYSLDDSLTENLDLREQELPSGAAMYLSSERTMLVNFWKLLVANPGIHLVSFNGRNFDAPWLMLRSAVLGVRPSKNLMDGTRFNYSGHTDLLDKLTYYSGASSGALRRFNFDFYARSFGIDSPKSEGVDGSKVQALFEAKQIASIAEYCLRDVRATWELFQKWSEMLKF